MKKEEVQKKLIDDCVYAAMFNMYADSKKKNSETYDYIVESYCGCRYPQIEYDYNQMILNQESKED